MKRRNRINGQFSVRLIEMLESPAYRVLTVAAHRVISRIEVELGHHGGNDNGKLPVTYDEFIEYGLTRESIAAAIGEAEALGFITVKRGRGGNAESRTPSRYGLTFSHDRGSRASPPTHAWRKIKTEEDAMRIAQDARQKKNEWAVKYAELRKQKNRKPVRETHTGTGTGNPHRKRKIPRPETRTTGSVQKPALLSISWVGEASGDNPPSTSIPSAASAPALVPFIGGNFGGHEISAQQRADLLAYYLFAMKYGEYMQQPEKREAA